MRILQIIASDSWGGGERYVFDLSLALKARGHEVEAVARRRGVVSERFAAEGIKVHFAPLSGVADVVGALKLSRLIAKGKVIIHTHNFKGTFTAAYARMLSGNRDVRIVTTRHLARPGKTDALHSFLYRHIDRLIFISQLARESFICSKPRIEAGKMVVVHNSIVCPGATEPADLRRQYGIAPEKAVIMYHGRIAAEKGVEVLVKAASLLPRDKFHLLIFGTGTDSYTGEIARLIAKLGLDSVVTMAGFLENVWEAVAGCDFGVLPTVAKEAFGLSNLEYMAAGKAHIATTNGAQREYADNGVNALLVPPGNEAQLAKAMQQLIDNKPLCHDMGERARTKYEQQLSYHHFLYRILAEYHSLY